MDFKVGDRVQHVSWPFVSGTIRKIGRKWIHVGVDDYFAPTGVRVYQWAPESLRKVN